MPKSAQQTTNEHTIVDLAVIATDLKYIKEDVKDIKAKLESEYVTRQEFDPIKKIVYGMVSVVLVAVVTALVTLVVKK